jgi:adenine-specific DNA-methyltransferase
MPRILRAGSSIDDVVAGRSRFASVCARVEDVEPMLPDGCAGLMPIDGPYHGVKPHGWDNEHDDERAFLAWKGERYRVWKRILAPNGTLYDFASPRMGARVEVACREHFEVIANVRWEKERDRGKHAASCKATLRSFFPNTETIVVAEQRGAESIEGSGYDVACDRIRGEETNSIRDYLDTERRRAGVSREDCNEACGFIRSAGGMAARHYFSRSQFWLPIREHYERLRLRFDREQGGPFLARSYDDLRAEFDAATERARVRVVELDHLRRPFFVTADDQYTDVWTYATVPHRKDKHPCEKPRDMARDIVRISSRPGDLVLVLFAGSGVFAEEALRLGRRAIVVEMDPHWETVARRRGEAVLRSTS